MKRPILILIIATTGLFSCKQNSKSTPATVDVETVNTIRKYEYADSMGKRLIIENSFSRGGSYTDSNGKEYSKIMFWTRIINETEKPLELNIDLPVNTYEVPTLPGKYFKILIPSDTMTLDKEPLQDYGKKDLKSFLDNSIHKSSSLKRTIIPKESSSFYVVTLFNKGVDGTLRTGLSLKEQNIFYRINDKEIHCGKINLKNLILQK